MPSGDGTGPRGLGAMTGGGRGNCVMPADGYVGRPRFGRQVGRGGRGRRNMYYATGMTGWQRSVFTPKQEKEVLKNEAENLKQELSDIQSRIGAMEKGKEED